MFTDSTTGDFLGGGLYGSFEVDYLGVRCGDTDGDLPGDGFYVSFDCDYLGVRRGDNDV